MQNIKTYLDEARVLSVDLWNTILHRKCHPEMVKKRACDALFLQFNFFLGRDSTPDGLYQTRLAAERSIRRKNRIKHGVAIAPLVAVLNLMGKRNGITGNALEQFVEAGWHAELGVEKEVSYPDIHLCALLTALPRKCFYLAEYHAGTEFIQRLLDFHNIDHLFDRGYASCDLLEGKGRGVTPLKFFARGQTNWTHVSTDPDRCKLANRLGAKDLQFTTPKETRKMQDLEHALTIVDNGVYWSKSVRGSAFDAGVYLAPMFAGYILMLAAEAVRLGCQQVCFYGPNRAFLSQLFDMAMEALGGCTLSLCLALSPKSTFLASLPSVDLSQMESLFEQNIVDNGFSLMKLLVSDPLAYQHHFTSAGVPWTEPAAGLANSIKLHRIWNTPALKSQLEAERLAQQALLKAYTEPLLIGSEPVLLAEVGSQGRTQNNLARLYPDRHWRSVRFGIGHSTDSLPPNTSRMAAYPLALDREMPHKNALFREVLTAGLLGPALFYLGDAKAVHPIMQNKPEKHLDVVKYATSFQKGVRIYSGELLSDFCSPTGRYVLSLGDIVAEGLTRWKQFSSKSTQGKS